VQLQYFAVLAPRPREYCSFSAEFPCVEVPQTSSATYEPLRNCLALRIYGGTLPGAVGSQALLSLLEYLSSRHGRQPVVTFGRW
jgi:hypothetical protein